ncbi:MAG: hypothetical protein KAJ18_08945 [Candidatus Omnitrophica bacterium]|nr:hypothetical protein [Candidatus Omnitrophota bacterium]
MIPWILLDKVSLPGDGKELRLSQRGTEYSIKVGASELMNSRAHSSEDALAKLACLKMKKAREPQILVGGLGMGFTLRVALNNLNARAHVLVAELVPEVVKWNHRFLSSLAKSPLNDKRVTVYEGDVVDKINTSKDFYHAILLDVDNGSEGLVQKKNDRLYSPCGLKAAYDALQSEGVLAVWSAGRDVTFTKHLRKAGFKVEEVQVPTHSGRKGGGAAVVWIAVKGK